MSTENQPELDKEFDEKFTHKNGFGEKEINIFFAEPYTAETPIFGEDQSIVRHLKSFIRSFALKLIDEIGLEEGKVSGDWTEKDIAQYGYNQAKADLDAKIKEVKQHNGL